MSLSVARYVTKVMERIAPIGLAEKWDNVGLLLEAPTPPPQPTAHKILLTIDLTSQVANEALALPASCVISYHPTIFKPLSSITLANPLQASLLRCAAAGISVYSPHTSLDSVYGGINDWLASGLGKGDVQLIGEDMDGKGGAGRVVRLDEGVSLAQLQERIKSHLGLQYLQVAVSPQYPRQKVQSVAICAGSGGGMLLGVDADVYFTGEMSHHEVLAAVAAGKNVILCGHTNTERGYLPVLASKLQEEFAKAEGEERRIVQQATVHVSTEDRHPLAVV